MLFLKRLFDFYIDASIHVSLSVISLVYVTAITFNIIVPGAVGLFIFFGAISCYNFIKYGAEAEKYIVVANRYHKSIQFFSFGCLLVALWQLFYVPKEIFMALLGLAAITGLYTLPVLPTHKNFRSFSGFKILIVAVVWAGTTVFLPVLSSQKHINMAVWIAALQRVLLVLVLLVPFEIRDLKYDSPALKTLPQRLGIQKTKGVAVLWIVLFLLLSFYNEQEPAYPGCTKVLLSLVLLLVILKTQKAQTSYFSSFWVEAIPVFWLALLFCLSNNWALFAHFKPVCFE